VVEAWLDQWSARLNESQSRLDGVKAALPAVDDEAKARYGAQLLVLQEKIDQARAKLEEGRAQIESLGRSAGEAQDDVRTGMESAWETFKAGAEAIWADLAQTMSQAVASPEPPADRSVSSARGPVNEDKQEGGST
jgi:chromosome segregation ATPase